MTFLTSMLPLPELKGRQQTADTKKRDLCQSAIVLCRLQLGIVAREEALAMAQQASLDLVSHLASSCALLEQRFHRHLGCAPIPNHLVASYLCVPPTQTYLLFVHTGRAVCDNQETHHSICCLCPALRLQVLIAPEAEPPVARIMNYG